MQLENIPKSEQKNIMESFWTMLQECESKADCDKDPELKHWVGQWYLQWNRVTGDSKQPVWQVRKNLTTSDNTVAEVCVALQAFSPNLEEVSESDLPSSGFEEVNRISKPVCEHTLKFVGSGFRNTDNYECTKCGEHVTRHFYND